MAYGKFSIARQCFQAAGTSMCALRLLSDARTGLQCVALMLPHLNCISAGQWEELLPLCTFQGDFSGLRDFVSSALIGTEAKMVEDLHWVLESRFARASAVGAITTPADWNVTLGGLQGAGIASWCLRKQLEIHLGQSRLSHMQVNKGNQSRWRTRAAQWACRRPLSACPRKQLHCLMAAGQSTGWMQNH